MASYIGRRKFLATFGGAAVAWPLAARAQQTAMPIVGLVNGRAAQDAVRMPLRSAAAQSLAVAHR
jgi:hypothetical protein